MASDKLIESINAERASIIGELLLKIAERSNVDWPSLTPQELDLARVQLTEALEGFTIKRRT